MWRSACIAAAKPHDHTPHNAPLTRRATLSGLALTGFVAASAHGEGGEFPDRPLRLVVGFPPGGPNDLLARIIAPGVAERLGRPVVVENRAGANGEIAAASVAKSPPDGSVFMLGRTARPRWRRRSTASLPYDVRTDFIAVAPVGINPMLLVVRDDLPAKDVAELLALARARPGKLNGASAGAGGATHLAWNSSSRWAGSTSCTCPTRAAGRRWPT